MKSIPLASVLFLITTAAIPVSTNDPYGVAIRDKSYDTAGNQLTFSVCNDNDKTLTAWSFSLVVAHGKEAERFSIDHDYHIRLYNHQRRVKDRNQGNGLIVSGECQAFQFPIKDDGEVIEPRALSVRLVAGVFDDASAFGERLPLTRLFSQRAAIIEELQASLTRLERLESEVKAGRSSAELAAVELRKYALSLQRRSAATIEDSARSTEPSVASAKREELGAHFISFAVALENDSVEVDRYLRILKRVLQDESEFRLEHSWFGGTPPSGIRAQ